MWVLPSRGRPPNVQRLLRAYVETEASTPVWLRIDDDDYGYSVDHPNWTVTVGPQVPLSRIYNEALSRFPESPFYGFIADDVVPLTKHWDRILIEIAGHDGMAVPGGGHEPEGAPHFVLGGDLVRSIGWLSLPGLNRLFIDTVWLDIAKQRNVLRRVPEVILEHRHFSNGKALFDKTYRKQRAKEDRRLYESWRKNGNSS